MTTPTTQISISDIQTELGLTANSALTLNDTNVRKLGGKISGLITMADLRNKTWILNLAGVQSAAGCYSAQGGFSVDRYSDGLVYLTMGVWPTDPPNCQTCSWQWLKNKAVGTTTAFNDYRKSTNYRPYWTQTWSIDITSLTVGQTVYTRAPAWPYTNVSYTYSVTKNSNNSISIVPYPNSWGTGDTGTSISVSNWWNNVVTLGGGDPNNNVLGSINLSWTDIGY